MDRKLVPAKAGIVNDKVGWNWPERPFDKIRQACQWLSEHGVKI